MKEYIERDWLVKEAEAVLVFREQHYTDKNRIADAASTVEWLKYYAPAADVVEVRHGYWIDKGWDGDFSWRIDGRGNCWHVYECSECKSQICGSPKTEWCSYCGAKMDKKE